MKQRQMNKSLYGADGAQDYNMPTHYKEPTDVGESVSMHKIRPFENYIEAQVQEGDTIQAVALRFHCSVSELKRINHMHKDNEMFARRTLKVPVTPYSVLTEAFAQRNNDIANTLTSSQKIAIPDIDEVQTINPLMPDTGQNSTSSFETDCKAAILNSKVNHYPKVYKDTVVDNSIISDTTRLLSPNETNGQAMGVETVVVKEFTSHGADFGIKWVHLVICILVLGFAIPLIYVFYIAERYEHLHDHEHEHENH